MLFFFLFSGSLGLKFARELSQFGGFAVMGLDGFFSWWCVVIDGELWARIWDDFTGCHVRDCFGTFSFDSKNVFNGN